MQKLTSPVVLSCMFEFICSQLLVLYAWVCLWQGIWEKGWGRRVTRPQPYPLGVKIKCLPGQEGNEQQYPAWAVLNLNRSYRRVDYNLTSVRKTQTEDGTIHADIICRHSDRSLLTGKKKGIYAANDNTELLVGPCPQKWGFRASPAAEWALFTTNILRNWM